MNSAACQRNSASTISRLPPALLRSIYQSRSSSRSLMLRPQPRSSRYRRRLARTEAPAGRARASSAGVGPVHHRKESRARRHVSRSIAAKLIAETPSRSRVTTGGTLRRAAASAPAASKGLERAARALGSMFPTCLMVTWLSSRIAPGRSWGTTRDWSWSDDATAPHKSFGPGIEQTMAIGRRTRHAIGRRAITICCANRWRPDGQSRSSPSLPVRRRSPATSSAVAQFAVPAPPNADCNPEAHAITSWSQSRCAAGS